MGSRLTAHALVALLVVALITPVSAGAAAPPTARQVITSVGFESPTEATLTALQAAGDDPTTAYWGRVTGMKQSGSYGLWCAGLAHPTNAVRSYGTLYPTFTRGRAEISVPNAADYYDARLGFAYNLPSRGAYDDISFSVLWLNPSDAIQTAAYRFPLTSSNSWAQSEFDMSSSTYDVRLSRDAARVRFEFKDRIEPPETYPVAGRGPTIDNVTVTGFMYGPPRTLTASQVPGGIALSWSKPQAAVDDTANDTRTISYRVWRTKDGESDWTELTSSSSRLSATSYTDTSAEAGQTYRYAVQAWHPTGSGYGTPTETTGRRRRTGLDIAAAAPLLVLKNRSFDVTYTVTDTSGEARGSLELSDNLGFSQSVGALAANGSHVVTLAKSLSADTTLAVTVSDASSGENPTDTRLVDVREPGVSLGITAVRNALYPGESTSVTYKVNNDGDTDLRDLVVTDGMGGPELAKIAALPAHESREFQVDRGSGSVSGYVTGVYGTPGTQFSGSVNAANSLVITPLTPNASKTTLTANAPWLSSYSYATVSLTAVAVDATNGKPIPTVTMHLQEYQLTSSGYSWRTVASRTGTGSYTFKRTIRKTTKFRVVTAAVPSNYASTSPTVAAQPYAYLTTPSKPSTVYRNRTFTSVGYVGPRHSTSTKNVKVIAYRLENGKWVARTSAYATNSYVSGKTTYNKYSARLTIRYAGYWKLRAYHAGDSYHRSTYSSWTSTFRVR